jgi:ribosomal protein S18 acetylase RimI-like enzyme
MSFHVRELTERDFFDWLGLFEGYSAFYSSDPSDEKVLRVWQWLSDADNSLTGVVAVDDDGSFIGFAHYRTVPDTLTATNGLYLDDLFVSANARSHGIGRALLTHVQSVATARNFTRVAWITGPDNERAQLLYDDMATRKDWVTYELEA